MNNFNEPNDSSLKKQEQDDFNKLFLIKLVVFMFFYRFYSMYIDQKGTLIGYIDDFLNKQPQFKPINLEIIDDDVD